VSTVETTPPTTPPMLLQHPGDGHFKGQDVARSQDEEAGMQKMAAVTPQSKAPDHPLYVVVRRSRTTILPPTPRPGDRIGGGLRRNSARHGEAHNDRSFDSNIDSSNDANDDGFIFRDNVASNARFSDGLRSRFRLRFSAVFSCIRSGGRSSLHSERYLGRYFLTNNDGYFERHNRGFAARFQLPGSSVQFGGFGIRSDSTAESVMSRAPGLLTPTLSSWRRGRAERRRGWRAAPPRVSIG